MGFILIEDDDFKKKKILDFLNDHFSSEIFYTAGSVTSAIDLLKNEAGSQLILLDMSLPTYDHEKNSDTGRPQGFGGIEILRYMEFIGDERKVIVVTQFDSFTVNGENMNISHIERQLNDEFSDVFIGVVQFDVISDSWKNSLINLILESIK
ncbi:CheY-like chemotaxis protein [Rahnella inusitata]|nr:CheY-like chemotaxis protein [Rahnella inusitata]